MERILIVKLAGIGDLLTATPALRALRDRFRSAHLTALVTPPAASLLDGSPLVDEVIPFDKFRYDTPLEALHPASLARVLGFLAGLRRQRFDRVAIMHHLMTHWGTVKFAALSLATGAPRRLGADDGPGWFLTERVPDEGYGSRHEVECWLDLVGAWGATNPAPRLEVSIAGAGQPPVELSLPPTGYPLVAIHPGIGQYAPARRWAASRFAGVADALAEGRGAGVVILGGPDDVGAAAEVAGQMRAAAIDLSGRTTLPQLAAVLHRCSLLVANDGGVMHLAAAVGTPVVAVFGPTNARAWAPWDGVGGARTRVVRVDLPCSPCLYVGHTVGLRFGCPAMTCLKAVTPDMVLAAVQDLLGPPAASPLPTLAKQSGRSVDGAG